ncbi:MAG: hypothetical protein EOO65_04475, partial [Methanosarcinales archaeon]
MGHFGYIKLELPVFHIGFLRATIELLQCICKTCSRVLLAPAARKGVMRLMRTPGLDTLRKARLRKRVTEDCKKVTLCPWCHALNGQVKKVVGAQTFKLVHDRYKAKTSTAAHARSQFEAIVDTQASLSAEIVPHVKRAMEDLNPLRVRDLFTRIPAEDLDLIWADAAHARPESMILTHVLVPPVCIRPSVPMDGGGGGS